VYLDNAATSRIAPKVLEAMMSAMTGMFANPHSPHDAGREAAAAVQKARETIAKALGANVSPKEILFTSGGTEANNLALRGVVLKELRKRRAGVGNPVHLITTTIEHDSVLETVKDLTRAPWFCEVDFVKVDGEGRVDLVRFFVFVGFVFCGFFGVGLTLQNG
jgi:cysteine desulfurase